MVTWGGGREPSDVAALRARADEEGWSTLLLARGLWICGGGPRPPRLTRVQEGRVLVVGHLFGREDASRPAGEESARERCRRLSEAQWGRYAAVVLDAAGVPEAVFRDPSGALDCVLWRWGAVVFVASGAPPWLVRALRLSWSVDWEKVADILADPLLITADPPLRILEGLAPGELRPLREPGGGSTIWSPAAAARRVEGNVARAEARLRSSLESVIAELAEGASGILVEVSGGLDSAIVAATLAPAAPTCPVLWWNFWGPFAESDERPYACAVAERLGAPLVLAERPEPAGAEAFSLEHPPAFRPGLGRIDAAYEAAQSEVCRSRSLDTVLTGKGGDAALFQTATTAVLADRITATGPLAFADPTALALARRLRRSVWAVGCRAVRVAGRALRRSPCGLAAAEVRARRAPPHPWLRDLAGLPLGKRIQIAGFVHHLSMQGLSRRTDEADLLHPFLTQPVMEACLAVPTPVLTLGGHDRMLARRAFADCVPEAILRRRSKGALGAYFARCVMAAGEPLRAHLLEGRLAAAGLLDRPAVEAALDAARLVTAGYSPDITLLAAVESWARAWSGEPPPWRR